VSKIFPQFFTTVFITSFLTTAFFCSCTGSAETSLDPDVHLDEAGCCDSSQGKTSHSSEKHCDCYVIKMVNADITAKTFLAAPGSISQQWFILNNFFSNKSVDVKYNLSYMHGPPGPIAVVPLYIQFHSFRI